MSEPRDIVVGFIDAWNRMDFEAIIGCLDTDIYYHNMPLSPISGREAVVSYLREAWTFSACEWTLRSIAASGYSVLTERIDAFTINGRAVVLPVMGVFEISEGRITQWRDYFDLASYRAQLELAAREPGHSNEDR